jgi:hypothetical protein
MNRGELRAELMDLVRRTDYTIAKANSHLTRAIRRIQRVAELPNQEKVINVAVSADENIPIPTDYLSTQHFFKGLIPFEKVSLERFARIISENFATEDPKKLFYARAKDVWNLHPVSEGDIVTLIYHATWPIMTADSDYNSITLQAPDCVIYCAASYAGTYFMDSRTGEWEQRYNALAHELKEQQWNQEMSTSSAQSMDPVYSHDGYEGGW